MGFALTPRTREEQLCSAVMMVELKTVESAHSPVYSAMDVMEEAVEPLSQSLSAVRLVRLPGNDSTESQLDNKTGRFVSSIIMTRGFSSLLVK